MQINEGYENETIWKPQCNLVLIASDQNYKQLLARKKSYIEWYNY
jgi:hypothetical protein